MPLDVWEYQTLTKYGILQRLDDSPNWWGFLNCLQKPQVIIHTYIYILYTKKCVNQITLHQFEITTQLILYTKGDAYRNHSLIHIPLIHWYQRHNFFFCPFGWNATTIIYLVKFHEWSLERIKRNINGF